jgi:hypothetical protein
MGEISDVFLVEIVTEWKCVISVIASRVYVVFGILYILTSSRPDVVATLAAHQDLHSVLKRGVAFMKIEDVEGNFAS